MIQSFRLYSWQVVEYWQGVDLVFDFGVGVSLLILNHPVLGSEDVVLFEFYNVFYTMNSTSIILVSSHG